MSRYVMDTGIVLGLLKGASFAGHVIDEFTPFSAPHFSIQSIVSVAELDAMGLRRNWGKARLDKLSELVRKIPVQDINHPSILKQYAEIDAFRQNGHPVRKLPEGQSGFAMGDNDIWIAATASAIKAILLTTDKDFLPLNGVFLDVAWIDPKRT